MVNSLTDTGAGSGLAGDFRYCVANATSGNDTINFGVAGTINLNSALPALNTSVAILGPGAGQLTVERVQSNFTSFGIFTVGSAANVQISGLTIANANVSAIDNAGTLTVSASTLSGNSTYASRGGAIYNTGTLTVSNSTLSGNSAHLEGGAIYDAGGTLTLDHSTLSGNQLTGDAGGGLYVAGGMVYVNQSTFSSNLVVGFTGSVADACSGISAGDGYQGEGGGLFVAGGTVSIDNSTFSANEARGGDGGAGGYCPDAPDPVNSHVPGGNGGPSAGGGIRIAAGTVQVQHSTFSGNRATGGLGGYDDNYGFGSPGLGTGGGISNAGGLQMYDTILAGNTADVAPDLDGAFASLGHNLIGNSTGGSGYAATDLLNVDPQLGPLQNNGGPTPTMALMAGSPAIDAGDNSGAPAYDQRGAGFARIVGVAIDIGAFEVQTPTAPQAASFVVSGFSSSTTAGVAGGFTVTAKNADGTTATGYTGTVHFTSSDPRAVLPADYTFTAADAGVHTFSATLKTAGAQSLTVADTTSANLTGSETGITVNPAAASVMIVAGFPSTTTAGVAGNFTITLRDPYGNMASGYTGTVHFTSSDAKAVLPASYTFTAADAGVRTFSATLKTAGTQTLTAADTTIGGLSGSEAGITVNPAAASKFLISAPTTVQHGVAFSLTLTVEDAYGNVVTGYTGTVHFSSTDNKATLPANYTFTAADNGVHTFTGLILRKTGTQKITLTDTLNSSLTGSVTENVF